MLLARMEERGVRWLDGLARRVRGGGGGPAHLETGLKGERAALFYLRQRGATVVARRWSTAKVRGDIDLIAWSGDTLCFVEVKSRTARDMTPAESAVDRAKRKQLRALARVYLKSFEEPGRSRIKSRFDVVSVYLLASGAEFEMLESAFGWSEADEARWQG